jgi:hypothetical protein
MEHLSLKKNQKITQPFLYLFIYHIEINTIKNMKRTLIILFTSFLALTNCSVDNQIDNQEEESFLVYWHLRNVIGGVSDVNNDFELDDIVWFFDETTGELTVENNNTDDTIEDGLSSGLYQFSFETEDSDFFLFIDGNEFGYVESFQFGLIIDQNIQTAENTTISDGFVYAFDRVLVPIE